MTANHVDNIATPVASSFGDLITLIILTFLTSLLVNVIRTYWATALLVLLSLALPGFIVLVWRNPYVSELLFEGWTATILSMAISRLPINLNLLIVSGSGVLLQRFVNQYDALPLILPVTASLAGNVGCIFASRLSTMFHASNRKMEENPSFKSRDNLIVMGTLFSISLPIHLAFLGFVRLLGTFKFGVLFLFAYLLTGALSVCNSMFQADLLDCGFVIVGICGL
jgi:solute carrier family 41